MVSSNFVIIDSILNYCWKSGEIDLIREVLGTKTTNYLSCPISSLKYIEGTKAYKVLLDQCFEKLPENSVLTILSNFDYEMLFDVM
jgi:hypothetical protein